MTGIVRRGQVGAAQRTGKQGHQAWAGLRARRLRGGAADRRAAKITLDAIREPSRRCLPMPSLMGGARYEVLERIPRPEVR